MSTTTGNNWNTKWANTQSKLVKRTNRRQLRTREGQCDKQTKMGSNATGQSRGLCAKRGIGQRANEWPMRCATLRQNGAALRAAKAGYRRQLADANEAN